MLRTDRIEIAAGQLFFFAAGMASVHFGRIAAGQATSRAVLPAGPLPCWHLKRKKPFTAEGAEGAEENLEFDIAFCCSPPRPLRPPRLMLFAGTRARSHEPVHRLSTCSIKEQEAALVFGDSNAHEAIRVIRKIRVIRNQLLLLLLLLTLRPARRSRNSLKTRKRKSRRELSRRPSEFPSP